MMQAAMVSVLSPYRFVVGGLLLNRRRPWGQCRAENQEKMESWQRIGDDDQTISLAGLTQ